MTKRKVLTNYRFMLTSAGFLANGEFQHDKLRDQWPLDATQLFWDRQIFSGEIDQSNDRTEYQAAFFRHEIHKLLGYDVKQGRPFVFAAYRTYAAERANQRFAQLERLKGLLAA